MRKIKIIGTLKELKNNKRFLEFAKNNPECTLVSSFEVLEDQRSKKQNRLYWLWVETMAQDYGYNKEELHDIISGFFLPGVSPNDEFYTSTTEPRVGEFAKFLTDIFEFFKEFGYPLPLPEEKYWEEVIYAITHENVDNYT